MFKLSVITKKHFQRPLRIVALFCSSFKSHQQQNHYFGSSETPCLKYWNWRPAQNTLPFFFSVTHTTRPAVSSFVRGWKFTALKDNSGWSMGAPAPCAPGAVVPSTKSWASGSLTPEWLLASTSQWSSLKLLLTTLILINTCKNRFKSKGSQLLCSSYKASLSWWTSQQ